MKEERISRISGVNYINGLINEILKELKQKNNP
jgi:hypothetical protein